MHISKVKGQRVASSPLAKLAVFLFPFFLSSLLYAQTPGEQSEPLFKLSDEELKMLNLGEKETQEIKQFFDALNNLTPEQKRELEELGRQTEESMRKKNLDPSNFEDLVKFMEEEGLAPQQPSQPQAPALPFPPAQPLIAKPEEPSSLKPLSTVVEAKDALMLLNDIAKYLNSFKHKTSLHNSYKNKIKPLQKDLIELSFYLEILKQPDLVTLLGTSEFNRLYKSLEALRSSLMLHEPSITMDSRRYDEDNPYEVLDIQENATPEQIQKAYENLYAVYSPEAVKERLKEEGLSEKELQKETRKAQLFFSFITEAYNNLKDPKQKAFIDRTLKHKREQERRRFIVSNQSFDKVLNALALAFRSNNILVSIKGLLEKNKPQELLNARLEIEKEQKALERSKIPVKLAPTPQSPALGSTDKYGEFYQKMALENLKRSAYPLQHHDIGHRPVNGRGYQGGQAASPLQKENQPAQGPQEKKSAQGRKEEKTKEKSEKEPKTETTGKKERAQGKKKEERMFSKSELQRYIALQSIEQILADATKLFSQLEAPLVEEGKPDKPSLLELLMKELDAELVNRADSPNNPAKQFKDLAEQFKIARLKKDLEAIAPQEKETLDDQEFKKQWTEKIVAPYAQLFTKLSTTFYTPLDETERKESKPPKLPLNIDKAKKYHLVPQPTGQEEGVNLGEIKQNIASIMANFEKTQKALASIPLKKT